jgi:hypothetical protein
MIKAIQPIAPSVPHSALCVIDRRPPKQAKEHKIQPQDPEIKIKKYIYFPTLAD